jgi:hypothetical protein
MFIKASSNFLCINLRIILPLGWIQDLLIFFRVCVWLNSKKEPHSHSSSAIIFMLTLRERAQTIKTPKISTATHHIIKPNFDVEFSLSAVPLASSLLLSPLHQNHCNERGDGNEHRISIIHILFKRHPLELLRE